MSQTTTATEYYLIESSGDDRTIWGPYTLVGAKRAKGKRHVVVTGDGLVNGLTMTRGAVQAAVQSGRIRVADGSSPLALAGC